MCEDAYVYLMRRLLTDFPRASVVDILRNTMSAMGTDSRLIIAEGLIPERAIAGEAKMVYAVDLGLMAISGGHRSMDQYKSILAEVGLRLVNIYKSEDCYDTMLETVLEAKE